MKKVFLWFSPFLCWCQYGIIISYPFISTGMCAYKGVRNANFSEYFVCLLHGRSLSRLSYCYIAIAKKFKICPVFSKNLEQKIPSTSLYPLLAALVPTSHLYQIYSHSVICCKCNKGLNTAGFFHLCRHEIHFTIAIRLVTPHGLHLEVFCVLADNLDITT